MKEQKANKFWDWFVANNKKYLFIGQVDRIEKENLVEEFIQKLHDFNDNLFFEMGGHPEAELVELIITAEGDKEFFGEVEYLVDKAPKIDNWEIIAFKPPMGIDFVTEYGGYKFDPKKTIFIPLHSEEEPTGVGIRVCYPEYNEEEKEIFINGTYLMLDVILGEKSVTLDIDYLNVIQTPENIGDIDFMHLSEIEQFIDNKKNRT